MNVNDQKMKYFMGFGLENPGNLLPTTCDWNLAVKEHRFPDEDDDDDHDDNDIG